MSSTRPTPAPPLPSRLIGRRVRVLFKHMPRALSGDVEAVHQLRVWGRRLRVALPLLAERPDGRRVRRARKGLRHLVRTAGISRDLDVGLKLFESLLDQPATPAERRLRGQLRAARTRGTARLTRAFLDEDLPELRSELRTLVERTDTFFQALTRIRTSLLEQAGLVRSEIVALGNRYDPPRLHLARRRIRKLRYLAEVAEDLGLVTKEPVEQLKRLQSLLGKVQDHHVLAERMAAMAARAELRPDAALAAEARRLEGVLRERSRLQHRRWLESRPLAQVQSAVDQLGRRGPNLSVGAARAPVATSG